MCWVIAYFCMGYVGGCVHNYYVSKQLKGSDLIDAIGWGFLGPMIYLAYFIGYMDNLVLVKQKEELLDEKDINTID